MNFSVIVAALLTVAQGPPSEIPSKTTPIQVAFVLAPSLDRAWTAQAQNYLINLASSTNDKISYALVLSTGAGPITSLDMNDDPAAFVRAVKGLGPAAGSRVSSLAVRHAADKLKWKASAANRQIVVLGAPGQASIDPTVNEYLSQKGISGSFLPYASTGISSAGSTGGREIGTLSGGGTGSISATDAGGTTRNGGSGSTRDGRHQSMRDEKPPVKNLLGGGFNTNGTQSGIHRVRSMVITQKREFETLWKEHVGTQSGLGKTPDVDFSHYAVVAVFAGDQSATGYTLEIRSIKETSNTIDLFVDLVPPKGSAYRAVSQPWLIQPVCTNGKQVRVFYKG